MKNSVINFLIFGLACNPFFTGSAIAQISRVGTPPSEIYSNLEDINNLPVIIMEEFDIDKLIEEDKLPENRINKPLRFAKAFDVNINVKEEGLLEILPNNDKLWRLRIKSPGAYSLNLTFGEYVLPVGAKVFISNKSKTHAIGAFTEENNKQSKMLAIQPVEGDEIIIEYSEPSETTNPGKLIISRVGHDYIGILKKITPYDEHYRQSQWCNVDINCPEGDNWQTEKWSVCRIYINNEGFCSGSLINNTSNNYLPFFLTANHCIDTKYRANNSVFVFNYESPSCDGPDGSVSQTISGSSLMAYWITSDFSLLQLSSTPPSSYYPVWNGWDRRTITPSAPVACIHHPAGDVRKISTDNTSPSSDGHFWRVNDWNVGTVEGASSGAPFYNSDHRVVGQMSYGNLILCDPDEISWHGKFSSSWNGGGSSSSRLRDWLDPSGTGKYVLDNLRRQYITGPDFVCATNSTFTLHNVPGGDEVTWSVNPGNLVSPYSGSGSTATFHSVCDIIGNATITFTISGSRGPVVVSKDFISGGPDYNDVELDVFYSTGQHAPGSSRHWYLCPYTNYHIYLINNSSCSTSNYDWTIPGAWTLNYQYNNMISINTNYQPGGQVIVDASTCCADCGSVEILVGYMDQYWDCDGYYMASPNPADDFIELNINEEKIAAEGLSLGRECNLTMVDKMGMVKYKAEIREFPYRINTSNLPNGLYIINLINKDRKFSIRVMIEH